MEDEIRDPKAVLEALERAKADAKAFREERDAAQKALQDVTGERDKLVKDVESLTAKQSTYKNNIKLNAVKSKIEHRDPSRVLNFIDMSKVEIDDEDNVTGIDEAIADVKERLPELFDEKAKVGNKVDIFTHGEIPRAKTGSEMQVDRVFANL